MPTQRRTRGRAPPEEAATIDVAVLDHRERPLPKARVTLRPAAEPRAVQIPAVFNTATSTYRASVRPGLYVLRAQARGLEGQEREIQVYPAGGRETVILGEKGFPFYYRGRVRVPFEPLLDLVAATVDPRAGPEAEEEISALFRKLRLDPQEVPEEVHRSGAYLLRIRGAAGVQSKRRVLRELLGSRLVRFAGPVIAVRERSISYLTNELLIRFKVHVTVEEVRELATELGLEILRAVSYSPNTFHLASPEPPSYDLLEVAARLAERDDVEWAEPNLVTTEEPDAINPSDYLWPGVWDRQLVGTPDAWQLLQDNGFQPFGEPTEIIATVDEGIQSVGGVPAHAEFQGTVSDGSSKVYQLYDFRTLVPNNDVPIGSHGMGVAGVAAAMANNSSVLPGSSEGLAGAAPNCRIMGLIFPASEADKTDMYIWAAGFNPNSPRPGFPPPISPGADIFSTSYGFGTGSPISGLAQDMLDYLTTYGRGGKGCLCFFSTGNFNMNIFPTHRPWAAYERTFAIAASTLDTDGVTEIRAPTSGWGEQIEVCAPSSRGAVHNPPQSYRTWSTALVDQGAFMGHPAVQTTLTAPAAAGATQVFVADTTGLAIGAPLMLELPGALGNEYPQIAGAPDPITGQVPVSALLNAHIAGAAAISGPRNYMNFGGTSSATPLTAGVAALMLSAEPDLTWIEARQLLRDTAAKINPGTTEQHPTDPAGDFRWRDVNGNPSVTSGLPPVFSPGCGYGRVNAELAVQGALAYAFTRDLVVRDNLADTGAVPSGGAFWNSPDIWVRNADPAAEGAAALPAGYGAAGPHQSPIAGQDNWVYARFRNNGTDASLDFYVRIYITHFPGTEFTYPSSFTPSNRSGDPIPSPMTPGTYLIDEIAYTGLAAGTDAIVNVLWPQALIPPETVMVGGMNVEWHPCLLVEISPHDGPTPTGNHVWDANNLAQKNISIVYADIDSDFAAAEVIGHPENEDAFFLLEIDRSAVPRQVKLFVDLLSPQLKARLQKIAAGKETIDPLDGCAVTFLEGTRVWLQCDPPDGGGFVLAVAPKTRLHTLLLEKSPPRVRYNFSVGFFEGREVAFLADRGTTTIPVFAGKGALVPIVVGGSVGSDTPKGTYPLAIVQREPSGRPHGGSEVEIRIEG
jgi:hypothetical protein